LPPFSFLMSPLTNFVPHSGPHFSTESSIDANFSIRTPSRRKTANRCSARSPHGPEAIPSNEDLVALIQVEASPTPAQQSGGVEKNFGWLRAFVQVKAINYGNVNLSNSNASMQTEVETSGLSVRNFVNTNSGVSKTSISADVVAVTGGITIPLWHP
jgi:hypothetical protein